MIRAIQENVTWRAIPIAGIAAGTVFLLTNLILTPAFLDISAALVLRYMASLVLGSDVLIDDAASIQIAGLIVHYVLSMIFTLVIAIVVHQWGLLVGIIGGTILGLAFYSINLYTMTLVFDWFFAINSSVLLLSHALFGAVAGGVYERFDHYDREFIPEEGAA